MADLELQVLDERVTFSMRELCVSCAVPSQFVRDLVDEGVISPRGRRPTEWRFDGYAAIRIRTARRLQRDLGVNLPGIALALDLMAELGRLAESRPPRR